MRNWPARRRCARFAMAAWLATGCRTDIEGFADRLTTPDERRFAAEYLRLLQDQAIDSAFALLVPEMRTTDARTQLAAAAALLAAYPPDSLTLIGVQSNSAAGVRSVNLSWEYRSGARSFAANVAARHGAPGPFRAEDGVYGFHVQPLDRPLRELNAFTLGNRSPAHYVWLAAAIGLPIFCLATAIRLATARGLPRRWLWALFALVGMSPVTLNWATGSVAVRMLAVQLLSAGAIKGGPASPWLISLAFPLGAVLGLIRYRAWRRGDERPEHDSNR